jgi:hypothetical protein
MLFNYMVKFYEPAHSSDSENDLILQTMIQTIQ